MNHSNVRNLSGLSSGYFNYLDVAGNIIQQDGTFSTNQDISGSTLVGVPLTYFNGLKDNIQHQVDDTLSTISSVMYNYTTKTLLFATISNLIYYDMYYDISNYDANSNTDLYINSYDISSTDISMTHMTHLKRLAYNNWKGINIFNSYLPVSNLLPTQNEHLTNKTFIDITISNLLYYDIYYDISNYDVSNNKDLVISKDVSGNITHMKKLAYNNWKGVNIFNSHLPISNLLPTQNEHLTNKSFMDITISNLL